MYLHSLEKEFSIQDKHLVWNLEDGVRYATSLKLNDPKKREEIIFQIIFN